MSKLSIYETGWINLVFEGKNKEYGAYQLRQENPRTTTFAFFFGLLFVASISGLGMILSSFGTNPNAITGEIFNVPIHLDNLPNNPPKKDIVVLPKKTEKQTDAIDKKDLVNPEIVKHTEPTDIVRRNDEAPTTTTPPGEGSPTGTGTTPEATGTETGTAAAPALPVVVDNGNDVSTAPDVMPEFPGGITRFLTYVGNNFEKPEIDETVVILMSFVVEKDGSMSNIKVLRNPGYGLDKEAIRVLKSQRTKWKPGIKNGKPIRVLYSLPIRITKSN